MTLRASFAAALTLAIPLLAAGPAFAQADASEQSAEEIEQLFQKHRGLVLAPAEGATDGGTEGTTVAATPDAYVEIPKEDQVYVTISFDFDSAALRPDQKPRLAALCQAMHNVDVEVFRIVGHTDAVGSPAYNDRLSLLRAQEVKRHLVGDCGIAEERLEAVGVGQRHLLNPDDPAAQENRRVEFQAIS
jgi:outer membrane protein OmpA-like peptidoglycan-associated protein